jgi:hypothetical protein
MTRCVFKKNDGKQCKLKSNNEFCHIHIKNPECSICYNKIPTDNTKLLCNHIFHNKCIDDWFERNSTCPLCRIEVTPTKFKIAVSDNPILTNMDVNFFLQSLRSLEYQHKFKGNKLALDIIDQTTCGVYNFHTRELLGSFQLN